MSLPAPATCTHKLNTTFANTVRVSQKLETNCILPLKSGDTIDLSGFRATGEKDLVTINFQFDAATYVADNEAYIYAGDRAGTVVSVSEAHSTPSTIASGVTVTKRSAGADSTVVLGFGLEGPANTSQSLPLVGAEVGLLANDALRLDVLASIVGVTGAVLSVVIELD